MSWIAHRWILSCNHYKWSTCPIGPTRTIYVIISCPPQPSPLLTVKCLNASPYNITRVQSTWYHCLHSLHSTIGGSSGMCSIGQSPRKSAHDHCGNMAISPSNRRIASCLKVQVLGAVAKAMAKSMAKIICSHHVDVNFYFARE